MALPTTPVLRTEDIANLAELLVCHDPVAATRFVEDRHRQGLSLETLYLDLLGPAANYLGRLWEQDICDFGDVTVALCHLRQLMRDLSPSFLMGVEHVDPRRRALLMTTPGDQHSFGLFMVAEFFRRAGWEVTAASPASRQDMAALVRREWYAVAGISAGCDARLEAVETCIRTLRQVSRNRSIAVMVGGPLFLAHPGSASEVGADAFAADASQGPQAAEKFLANMPARG